tara:strand:+ start:2143 stop:2706 length:564 start_codon:yes stop_codon:yes gene_type:complete
MNVTKEDRTHIDEAHYRYWHLGGSVHEGKLTDLEWCVLRFQQAFGRWAVQLGQITGMENLSYIEIELLNVIRMQDRPKTAASIARQLNRDDIPNIQYVLRKLVKEGLCKKVTNSGTKSVDFTVTKQGKKLTDNYAKVRRQILTEQTKNIDRIDEKLVEATGLLSMLTGLYDEVGRITSSYSPVDYNE